MQVRCIKHQTCRTCFYANSSDQCYGNSFCVLKCVGTQESKKISIARKVRWAATQHFSSQALPIAGWPNTMPNVCELLGTLQIMKLPESMLPEDLA